MPVGPQSENQFPVLNAVRKVYYTPGVQRNLKNLGCALLLVNVLKIHLVTFTHIFGQCHRLNSASSQEANVGLEPNAMEFELQHLWQGVRDCKVVVKMGRKAARFTVIENHFALLSLWGSSN
jgi:hypothetical protein